MQFPSYAFLAFFAVVFPVYWAIPRHRPRMLWLFLASCAFYMSWNPWLIGLILFSASADYFAALLLERTTSPTLRRALLVGSIGLNLSLLGYFKYANFFLDSAGHALGLVHLTLDRPTIDVVLPLGISFYTFETISYIADVYLGRTRAVRNPLDYGLFIMFFPHLVAGPIVRPHDFLPQIAREKRFDWDRLHLGARMFLIGFFKKTVIADHLGQLVVDPVFAAPASYASAAVWLGVLAYAVQIYGDFSGYSDMGIGLAHMFGFKLPANFRFPYLADSIADFWRRWHISLSTWLRDYLYIPLGGNRRGPLRTYANLIIVMLLGGLWHGASWTFVAWGLFHGILLALQRAVPRPRALASAALRPVCVITTFVLVCVGWVFFRAQQFGDAATILQRMAWPTEGQQLAAPLALLVVACLALTLLGHLVGETLDLVRLGRRLPAPLVGTALAGLLALALLLFPDSTRAFIYFQF